MNHSLLVYFALVRGFLQFGFLAALIYVLLNVAVDGTLASVRWRIAIGFPIVGIVWGFLTWFRDRRETKS